MVDHRGQRFEMLGAPTDLLLFSEVDGLGGLVERKTLRKGRVAAATSW
jgi:hypothetical protein